MISPQRTEEFSKHQYLNRQIEDFYEQCEQAIKDRMKTIKKMKKQVNDIE